MSRVLIWKKVTPGSEYDIFRGECYQTQISKALHSGIYNVGNRLWFQGIMSAIDTGENQYDFLPNSFSPELINSSYDFIILPMANIFNIEYTHFIRTLAAQMAQIRIPVYVIACGAQARNYNGLSDLIREIGEISKKFIYAVYSTGGEFALRGEFTKEFFTRLGFDTAVVTGCPSMFQLGRNLSVKAEKSSFIKPVFNGAIKPITKLLEGYENSLFFDQDCYMAHLYQNNYTNAQKSFKGLVSFYCDYGMMTAKLLADNRIRLIPDMYEWWHFLKNTDVNYSFGSRIHGNIMPILAGIPATVVAMDSRTQEMAEFFHIPHVKYEEKHIFCKAELEKFYSEADYSTFNETFSQKYDAFELFLSKHGIVKAVNQENRFFGVVSHDEPLPEPLNQEAFQKVYEQLKQKEFLVRSALELSKFKKYVLNLSKNG